MGLHDDKVNGKLGENVVSLILEEVRSGSINNQKMIDFAQALSKKIGGNHTKRNKSDDAEMRNILSDWWEEDLYSESMTRENAKQTLVGIFSHDNISLNHLADLIHKEIPSHRRSKVNME